MTSTVVSTTKSAHMNTKRPTRKVAFSVLAAAITTIIVWLLNRAGVQVPPEVATAMVTLVTASVGYLVPPGAEEQVVVK